MQAVLGLPEGTHIALRFTSTILIGELCEWIKEHPDYLGKFSHVYMTGLLMGWWKTCCNTNWESPMCTVCLKYSRVYEMVHYFQCMVKCRKSSLQQIQWKQCKKTGEIEENWGNDTEWVIKVGLFIGWCDEVTSCERGSSMIHSCLFKLIHVCLNSQ